MPELNLPGSRLGRSALLIHGIALLFFAVMLAVVFSMRWNQKRLF